MTTMPALRGSERQIEWAEEIRARIMQQIDTYIRTWGGVLDQAVQCERISMGAVADWSTYTADRLDHLQSISTRRTGFPIAMITPTRSSRVPLPALTQQPRWSNPRRAGDTSLWLLTMIGFIPIRQREKRRSRGYHSSVDP